MIYIIQLNKASEFEEFSHLARLHKNAKGDKETNNRPNRPNVWRLSFLQIYRQIPTSNRSNYQKDGKTSKSSGRKW